MDAAAPPSVAEEAEDNTSTFDAVFRQIILWKGDITTLHVTAIVNAIVTRQGHNEPVGQAKISPTFALRPMYVIHTVNPELQCEHWLTTAKREQLQSCYTQSMDPLLKTVSHTQKSVTIVLPCLSTGMFHFSSDQAVPLSVDAVRGWLRQHSAETSAWKVIFNTFLQKDDDLYRYHFQKLYGGLVLPSSDPDPALEVAYELIEDANYLFISIGPGLSAAERLDYMSEEVMKKYHASIQKIIPQFRTMYSSIGYTK